MRDSDNNIDDLNNEGVTENVGSGGAVEAADDAASIVSENSEPDQTQGNTSSDSEDIEIMEAHEIPDDEFHTDDSTPDAASDKSSNEQDVPEGKQKRKRTKADIVRYVIMALAGAVFIYAAVNIAFIAGRYIKEEKNNDAVKESVLTTITNATTTEITDNKGNTYPNIDISARIDFEKLKEINPNAVGWVSVPTVDVDYPIVHGDDNDYYLSHAFNNEFSWSGSIFLDYRNNPDLADKHSFIYGHHMNDGSMFTGLLKYDDEEFYKKNEGKNYFYIYTEKKVNVYEIVSISDVNIVDHPTAYRVKMDDSFTLTDYMDFIKSVELYDTGIKVTNDDTLVTLFTCQADSSSNVRHMVHGKLIAELDY